MPGNYGVARRPKQRPNIVGCKDQQRRAARASIAAAAASLPSLGGLAERVRALLRQASLCGCPQFFWRNKPARRPGRFDCAASSTVEARIRSGHGRRRLEDAPVGSGFAAVCSFPLGSVEDARKRSTAPATPPRPAYAATHQGAAPTPLRPARGRRQGAVSTYNHTLPDQRAPLSSHVWLTHRSVWRRLAGRPVR